MRSCKDEHDLDRWCWLDSNKNEMRPFETQEEALQDWKRSQPAPYTRCLSALRGGMGTALHSMIVALSLVLDTAVGKDWGYASEMGRHIREGREPERKEVELIVGLAATVATYLCRYT